MRIEVSVSSFIAAMVLVPIAGCESGGYGRLHERFDEKSGKMAQEYVLPCYVSRTYIPFGTMIKKDEPQRNLIRLVDGSVKPMGDANICLVVTDDGMLKPVPESCPKPKVVSPEMCEEK